MIGPFAPDSNNKTTAEYKSPLLTDYAFENQAESAQPGCHWLLFDDIEGCSMSEEGSIPVLPYETEDTWRENFCGYDMRW